MNKTALITICIIIVIALFFFFMHSSTPKPVLKQGPIIIFGDSLVAGVGATEGNDVVSVLSRRLGVSIINAGISGNTTEQGLARLDADVLSLSPSIVVVILGGNDFLRRVPKETTLANIRTIIERVQASGAVVVLAGIDSLVYNASYKNIADGYDAPFISNLLGEVRSKSGLMSDSVHPNNAGYILFADAIEKELRELL